MKYTIKDFLEVKASGSPSFSPDGTHICYISNTTGTSQIYLVQAHIENSTPIQITHFEDSVNFASFSPTKNEIVFAKDIGGNEQMQLYVYSLETKEIRQLTNNTSLRHNFGRFSQDGNYVFYGCNERNGTDMDVYRMNLATTETELIYSGSGSHNCVGVSKDDKTIVIRKSSSNVNNDLFLYNFETKDIEHITPHSGDECYGSAVWIKGDSGFFTITNKDTDFFGLSFYDVTSKKFIQSKNPEWDVDGFSISYDSKYIALIINEDGYNKFSLFNIENLNEPIITSIPQTSSIGSISFSKDSKYIAVSMHNSTHTTNVWLYSIEDNTLKQITNSHQGVPSTELVEPELMRYKSFDGLTIPSFLYKPKTVTSDKKLPVIINIHGGPEAQAQPSYVPLTQYFVHQGYAVFTPNVRGSTGYGKTYLSLDDVEKRMDSVKDIVSLREHIKNNLPELDFEKIILYGGSYGGFMVLANLAFYPELWAGGVDTVGISNFVTFLENTAAYRRAIREAEYGSLEKDRDFLQKISPANHAEKIKAPLFIIHGANDPRVPLSETEQMVEKIKSNNGTVELLVYSDEGHGLSKLKNRLDAYPKVVEFINQIVK